MKVEGKGIVITGGSLGIGKAVALEFLKHGGLVIIADINEQALVFCNLMTRRN